MGRLINIIFGLVLLFLSTNSIFNYVDFSLSETLLGVILIAIGIISILASISFQKTLNVKPGISNETSSTKFKWMRVFLGIISLILGLFSLGILNILNLQGTSLSIVAAILGFL